MCVRFFWIVLSYPELFLVVLRSELMSSLRGRGEDIIDWHSDLDYPFWILSVTISVYRLYTDDFSLNTALFSSLYWQSTGDELDSLNTSINLSEIKDCPYPPTKPSTLYLRTTHIPTTRQEQILHWNGRDCDRSLTLAILPVDVGTLVSVWRKVGSGITSLRDRCMMCVEVRWL